MLTRLALAGGLALALALPVHAEPRDTGGNVFARATEIWWADARDRPHRIAGYCASACTMWLGYERTCVEPDAVLGFHSARFKGLGRSDALNRVLAAHYPPGLRAWFWAGPAASTRIVRVPAARLIAQGHARACEG